MTFLNNTVTKIISIKIFQFMYVLQVTNMFKDIPSLNCSWHTDSISLLLTANNYPDLCGKVMYLLNVSFLLPFFGWSKTLYPPNRLCNNFIINVIIFNNGELRIIYCQTSYTLMVPEEISGGIYGFPLV